MDSSVTGPYTDKPTPRRKAPVRKPRAKKEIVPISTSLISPVERAAIKTGQAKLVADTEKASATAIQRVIRNKNARTTLAKAKASSDIGRMIRAKVARDKPMDKPETPAPKVKKERKARVPRTPKAPKPVYKISYSAALKQWNASRSESMYCNPKKGTPEYNEVQALRL